MTCFFCSTHFCISVAAWPGNTICYTVMAETVLAVFPSHSEIGRTRCTTNKIIFVRFHSGFAIPSASKIRLIFGVFTYIKQALRLCPLLAVQSCALFPNFSFQRCFACNSHQKLGLAVSSKGGMKGGGLETSSSGGAVSMSGTFSELEG